MSLKKLALTTALGMTRLANELDIYPSPSQPRVDHRTLGVNPKRCKSCSWFKGCQFVLNRNPMDIACNEYHKKKKK